jgi:hypothetical protein
MQVTKSAAIIAIHVFLSQKHDLHMFGDFFSSDPIASIAVDGMTLKSSSMLTDLFWKAALPYRRSED